MIECNKSILESYGINTKENRILKFIGLKCFTPNELLEMKIFSKSTVYSNRQRLKDFD